MSQHAWASPADFVTGTGIGLLRWSLVGFIIWFGAFKFTPAEAAAIQPLVGYSPLLSWLYRLMEPGAVSRTIGSAELAIAVLLALRPVAPILSVLGSLGAIGMFLTTLSFTMTTPGSWAWVDGFPVPTEASGFIVKDIFLLGTAIVLTGEALAAAAVRRAGGSGLRTDRVALREPDRPRTTAVAGPDFA